MIHPIEHVAAGVVVLCLGAFVWLAGRPEVRTDVVAALRAADDRALDTETPWGASTTTIAALAMRMMYHNGTHAGEIIDLRRALGMGRVLE